MSFFLSFVTTAGIRNLLVELRRSSCADQVRFTDSDKVIKVGPELTARSGILMLLELIHLKYFIFNILNKHYNTYSYFIALEDFKQKNTKREPLALCSSTIE